MDKRTPLPAGTPLPFPGMACTVEDVVGRGSNAIVYAGAYPDELHGEIMHRVLIKELFPLHPRGAIRRAADGSVICEPEGLETYALHRRSFERGNEVHLRLLAAHPDIVGANLNTFAYHDTLYTVLGFSGGRTLEKQLAQQETSGLRAQAVRLLGLLDALEAFHSLGFVHLDISPDNILLIGQGESERVSLIDYNSVHSLAELQSGQVPDASAKEGYTAPEVRTGRLTTVGRAADLFSVSAVFYCCLMGAPPSFVQLTRPQSPDAAQSPYLQGAPETVRSMIRQILRRGLSVPPERRYQDIGAMRLDVRELIDRIDGVGVTHWALWDACRRNVARTIRQNPALGYLTQACEGYPLRGRMGDAAPLPIEECIRGLLDADAGAMLRAEGGMGKTTALLRFALSLHARYTPGVTAPVYIPLYAWHDGGESYIRDAMLEDLRFKPDTPSFSDARHALSLLLDEPLHGKHGERPRFFILLDGLNEAVGDTAPLIREIRYLSGLRGVRLLIAARGDVPELTLPCITLVPLTQADVQDVLLARGLLMPEEPEIRTLLQTPLMLSLFVQAAVDGGKQLRCRTPRELMNAYFAALRARATAGLAEGSPGAWRVDAALSFVLPRIAARLHSRGGALGDPALLPSARACYRVFASRGMEAAFPQWIGHSADIRGGARNAEEWYGEIVHGLLWRRLGLLMRDRQGTYRISHQVIEAYLLTLDRANSRRLRRRKGVRWAATLLAACVCLSAGWGIYARFIRPQPYQTQVAETVVSAAGSAFVQAGDQWAYMTELASAAGQDEAAYRADYDRKRDQILRVAQWQDADAGLYILSRIDESGSVMPWSYKSLDQESCRELIELPARRAAQYGDLLLVLSENVMNPQSLYYPDRESFLSLLNDYLTADGALDIALYQAVLSPHLEALREREPTAYRSFINTFSMARQMQALGRPAVGSEVELEQSLAQRKDARDRALSALYTHGAMHYLEQ